MGKIGSGKSLLLDGILAEITKINGIIAVNDDQKGFGYVKQNPWLQRGTIRDNILFGKTYDYNKYKYISDALDFLCHFMYKISIFLIHNNLNSIFHLSIYDLLITITGVS